MKPNCDHLTGLQKPIPPENPVCPECQKAGQAWVHLTQCLSCGYVGCCEESPGKHAHHHFRKTHHPVVRTLKPGEDWLWCYADELFIGRKAA